MAAAHPLLSRDAFRDGVFARDGHRCVVPGCDKPAVDAHHIIERALWSDPAQHGGYFLANGASVCEVHHRLAESNHLPPDALRRLIGARDRLLPCQLDAAGRWDKWGEPIGLPPRAGAAIKYPSTPYLPWSGTGDPQQEFAAVTEFVDIPLVATLKMDGANVKLTRDHVAARNGDHANHPQFDRLKALHAGLRHQVPEGLVLFAEWLRYTHSIAYRGPLALPGALLVFAVYDPQWEIFLGWDEVVAIAGAVGLPTVPVCWSGTVTVRWRLEHVLHEQAAAAITAGHEGMVVRSSLPFAYGHFSQRVAKHVRPNHVQLSDESRSLTALNDVAAGA